MCLRQRSGLLTWIGTTSANTVGLAGGVGWLHFYQVPHPTRISFSCPLHALFVPATLTYTKHSRSSFSCHFCLLLLLLASSDYYLCVVRLIDMSAGGFDASHAISAYQRYTPRKPSGPFTAPNFNVGVLSLLISLHRSLFIVVHRGLSIIPLDVGRPPLLLTGVPLTIATLQKE
jgi:hypothetical protein